MGANEWPFRITSPGVGYEVVGRSVAPSINYSGLRAYRRGAGRCLWQPRVPPRSHDSYLVDSASSHMLVSKIKPCMSKYKQLYCETANGSLNQLSFI